MGSPSQPRKRGSEDQLDNQIEHAKPDNTKRSKASLECVLEPIPAGDPKFTDKLPVLSGNRALHVIDSDVDNGPWNPVRGVRNQALQDYQMHLMYHEQQKQKRLLMEEKAREEQDHALRTISSLPDQLNIAHTTVKALLENLPAYFQQFEDFKHAVLRDTKNLHDHEENLNKKEAEINALENRYNELIRMTPAAQQGELRQVKDKALLTMQQDREKLRLERDNALAEVEGKNERIAGFERALGRSRELVPALIEDLVKLEPKLLNSSDIFRTI